MNLEITDILTQFNYPFRDMGAYLNFPALWRNGDDPTSVAYYKDKQIAVDFVDGQKYGLKELIGVIIGDKVKAEEYLAGKNIEIKKIEYKEKLKVPEYFDESVLKDVIPDFSYWSEERDIPEETAKIFKGGLLLESQTILGKMKRRQILNIYDSKNRLVGFTGRAIDFGAKIKWKHLGNKTSWVWPAYLNSKIIKELKEVILVESPGDILKMWTCDIKNVICLFGLECSFSIVNYLLKINPNKIIISSNNEESNRGNDAARKIYGRLKKYFNHNQLVIKLPYLKDFGEMSCDSIKDWYNRRFD